MKLNHGSMALLTLLLSLFSSPVLADDGWHLAVGLGAHDPAYDWHKSYYWKQQHIIENSDYYESNPLGIVKLHYQRGSWDVGLQHVSSIPNEHDGNGLTLIYVTVDLF